MAQTRGRAVTEEGANPPSTTLERLRTDSKQDSKKLNKKNRDSLKIFLWTPLSPTYQMTKPPGSQVFMSTLKAGVFSLKKPSKLSRGHGSGYCGCLSQCRCRVLCFVAYCGVGRHKPIGHQVHQNTELPISLSTSRFIQMSSSPRFIKHLSKAHGMTQKTQISKRTDPRGYRRNSDNR